MLGYVIWWGSWWSWVGVARKLTRENKTFFIDVIAAVYLPGQAYCRCDQEKDNPNKHPFQAFKPWNQVLKDSKTDERRNSSLSPSGPRLGKWNWPNNFFVFVSLNWMDRPRIRKPRFRQDKLLKFFCFSQQFKAALVALSPVKWRSKKMEESPLSRKIAESIIFLFLSTKCLFIVLAWLILLF